MEFLNINALTLFIIFAHHNLQISFGKEDPSDSRSHREIARSIAALPGPKLFQGVLAKSGFSAISQLHSNVENTNYSDDDSQFLREIGDSSQLFPSAAIVSDAPLCANVAKEILQKNGKIGDATIAALVCMGAVHPQSSGIGGGFVAVHYSASSKRATVINARERAPLKACDGMYDDKDPEASKVGGLAIAVPGEVKGYQELYKLFGGGVAWTDLFEPTVLILENGYEVSAHLAQALLKAEEHIKSEPALKEIFINPSTDSVWQLGEFIKEPVLAKTLRAIGRNGNDFYNTSSELNKGIMRTLKQRNSILSEEDFQKYQVTVTDALTQRIDGGFTMFTPSAPASGALLSFIFRILSAYRQYLKDDDVQTVHYFIEAMKHTYGRRGKIGDPWDDRYSENITNFEKRIMESDTYLKDILCKIDASKTNSNNSVYMDEPYLKQDHGTAHFVIVGENKDCISVTTTINSYFGSTVRSSDLGVIFNDQMHDFVIDKDERSQNPFNSIRGGKRPSSSASPAIFTDSSGVFRFAVGAAGGVRILSTISMVTMNLLWFGKSADKAISAMRFHHVMDPIKIQVEFEKQKDNATNDKFYEGLAKYGHDVQRWTQRTAVTAVEMISGRLSASYDPRKPGSVAGY